jgi:hypothetical protein
MGDDPLSHSMGGFSCKKDVLGLKAMKLLGWRELRQSLSC